MEVFTWLVFTTVWTLVCYNMAKYQGRDTGMAIAGGLIFGVFSVIYYLIVGNVKKEGV